MLLKTICINEDNETDYRGQHGAADKESGAPLWRLTNNGIYPDDIYSGNATRMYSGGDDRLDHLASSLIYSKKNKPNSPIVIYRAVPKSLKVAITPGDWVTPFRRYAIEHGKDNLRNDYKIIQKRVMTRDLFTDGDSWYEWGYDPQPMIHVKDYLSPEQLERRRARFADWVAKQENTNAAQ